MGMLSAHVQGSAATTINSERLICVVAIWWCVRKAERERWGGVSRARALLCVCAMGPARMAARRRECAACGSVRGAG
eukprot:6278102-Prymnesium_polylepis.3